MEHIITYALVGVSIIINIVVLLKLKHIRYLLEQPPVKKLTSDLKLKPIKVDGEDSQGHKQERNYNANRKAPQFDRNDNRNDRDSSERSDKPAGNRFTRDSGNRERNPRNDRADRNDRPDRNEKNDRFDRGPRNDRGHRPMRDTRDVRDNQSRPDRAEGNLTNLTGDDVATPAENSSSMSKQDSSSTRRPLPARMAREQNGEAINSGNSEVNSVSKDSNVEDQVFAGTDESAMQHGRRNQVKKVPRIEIPEGQEEAILGNSGQN